MKNASYVLTNQQIEEFYYKQLNELIRNTPNISKLNSYLNHLRSNIDCTVYIETDTMKKVTIFYTKNTQKLLK